MKFFIYIISFFLISIDGHAQSIVGTCKHHGDFYDVVGTKEKIPDAAKNYYLQNARTCGYGIVELITKKQKRAAGGEKNLQTGRTIATDVGNTGSTGLSNSICKSKEKIYANNSGQWMHVNGTARNLENV
ncbi:MAG: hypothetical protein HAW60_05790, partial [Bdellovibrionales bacterium]|nr:hypothetical protein [Bdellovibrionales bacterium]